MYFRIAFCLVFSLMIVGIQNLVGQEIVKNCWSKEYEDLLEDTYPDERSTLDQFEEWMSKETKNIDLDAQRATLWTVPVVFHIFHNGNNVGAGPNISAAKVQAQLDQINIDFANMAGSTDAAAGDSQIQFCLATTDPMGNCMPEPGINRIRNSDEGLNNLPHSTTYIESTTKSATIWFPNIYLNVWVTAIEPLANGGLILGYAQFPNNSGLGGLNNSSGGGNTDGVVVDYRTVGSLANTGPWGVSNGAGRTLTHELGHFFGLRHIWGDGGCGVDDFCTDTPESDAANQGCNVNHVSCGTTDMVRNYMDYTNDNCMRLFTQDQADRMYIVMGGNGAGTGSPRRESLANGTRCASCSTCGSMIALSGTQSGQLDSESGDWITSTQTIQAGAAVDYDGTTYVQLDPNFCAPATANFNAFIDGCNSGGGGINLVDNSQNDSHKNVTRWAQRMIEEVRLILFGEE